MEREEARGCALSVCGNVCPTLEVGECEACCPVALLLLAGSGSPCGGCIDGALASGGSVSVETSDSVEEKMTLRLSEGLQKWM